jgi:hypothetical protein
VRLRIGGIGELIDEERARRTHNDNVIELPTRNTEAQTQNREDVLEAMWAGIANSKWSKNPNDPDAPPSLAQFVSHVADQSPLLVLKLLAAHCIEPPTDNE